jgi:aspartate/methionine/tyrosine aminotransferase
MDQDPELFSLTPPDASAIAFIKYNMDINSTEFVRRLAGDQSVLIVPGDHFGLDHHLRISFGLPEDYLTTGLERIASVIKEAQQC